MGDERDLPEGVPPATPDIGLPTPPSPGVMPPIDLPPPAPEGEPMPGGADPTSERPAGEGER